MAKSRRAPSRARRPAGRAGAGRPSRQPAARPVNWKGIGIAVVVLGLLFGFVLATSQTGRSTTASTTTTTDGVPALASTAGQASGATVDGITCGIEQVAYHVHAHLAVYVNGARRTIPAGIGIPGCFYWLHSHTPDGIIHIESPDQRNYTLGQYFDIWHQPLTSTQVGPATGNVTAYVGGIPFSADPRTIPLASHTLIQLNVGTDTPSPQPFDFGAGL